MALNKLCESLHEKTEKMKNIIFALILLVQFISFGQSDLLLKEYPITNSTKLLVMNSEWDKTPKYKKYNFIIEDKKIIDSLSKIITCGKKTKAIVQENHIDFIILNGNKKVRSWIISPDFSNIDIDGKFYEFDLNLLENLSKKYHLDYEFYTKPFKNKDEYKIFENEIIKDEKLIYISEPYFKYEGSFDVEFAKNTKLTPKSYSEYLENILEKISSKNDFYVAYELSDYNIQNREQVTMNIHCSYETYKLFKDQNSIKKEWIPEIHNAYIYKKK